MTWNGGMVARWIVAAFAVLLVLGGCAAKGSKFGQTPAVTIAPENALPKPDDAFTLDSVTYRIGPNDKLKIGVFDIRDLQEREVVADSAGNVQFPLAGSIAAAGMTTAELSRTIAARLRAKYIRDPQVTVNVVEAFSQAITVEGSVNQPGIYPVTRNMTLLRAIAMARGTSERARLDTVVLFRNVGDKRYAAAYNLRAVRNGNYADPEVYPGDVITVDDDTSVRLFRDLSPLLAGPLIAILNRI